MKILITTEPDDIHALLVKLALEHFDQDCDLWFTADMPTQQTNSIYLSNDSFYWQSEDSQNQIKKTMSDPIDVVWWRRPRRPFVPETAHQNDMDCIKKENTLFHESSSLILASDAWWVNPYDSIKYANSKVYQLKLAPSCGLKIPPTLISNSPEDIKAFITKHDSVIYKPFFPHNWLENDVLKFSYTQGVALNQLPSDNLLQMTPGIFQQQLKKKYELRVTCFGEHLVAVKIDSQNHPKGMTDWRIAPTHELKLEPYSLSLATENSIRRFMKQLGIVFGCFDFIVTPDDDIYFLEVNQQGQFLWIEDLLPEVRMLDMFVHFVMNKSVDFKWKKSSESIKLLDFDSEATQLLEANILQHVYLNEIKKQGTPA